MPEYTLRRVRPEDAEIVCYHRMRMFQDMGLYTWESMQNHCETYIEWVKPRIADNTFISYFLCDGDAVIAGAALWLMPWSPHALTGKTVRGMVFNVYTEPDYRRQGLARKLVITLIEWCKDNEIDLVALHASDEGRPLYESLGFLASNEMQMQLGG